MHIGIVSPEFPPTIGGVESYAYGFAQALIASGYDVTVFTTAGSEPTALPGATIVPGLKIFIEHDRELLCSQAVDAWHVMNAAYAWLATCTDKPTVVSVHGNDFLNPYLRVHRPHIPEWIKYWRVQDKLRDARIWLGGRLTKRNLIRSLPAATRIVANSHYTEDVLLKMVPACQGKTTVAYVGIDTSWLEPPLRTRDASGGVNLLTVARLSEPRKNIDVVLRALSELRDDYAFTYSVVGDGSLRPELERLSADLELADRVRFHGFLSSEELRVAFAAADLFILTSSVLPQSHEGFGIVYLEANACGTPVLAARLAGAVDAVAEGVSGFFVDEPTAVEVRDQLRNFLDGDIRLDPTECRAFAERFRWSNIVKTVVPYYAGPN